MKSLKLLFLVAMAMLAATIPTFADPVDIGGDWDGTLAVRPEQLRLAFHFDTSGGTLTSIDQGGDALPFSSVVRDGAHVTATVARIQGVFQGTLSADGQSIKGDWTQGPPGATPAPLVLARRAAGAPAPVALLRPQEPHIPYPYRAERVVYDGVDGARLAGTLTMPRGPGHWPTAILISGSGPNDRNEYVMRHKPFLVLADYLTRHGIAVLRSDKRGVGASTGNYAIATSADFANDARAAIAYLKTRPEIDPAKIGLIGHSEGGIIAPMVAATDPSVAFIVLMAGPGLKGEHILDMQRQLEARAEGVPEAAIAKAEPIVHQAVVAAETARDDADALAKAKAILLAAGLPDDKATAQATMLASPWFRFFLSYDPAPTLQQVKCPVLAINGGKDVQVPPKEDLAAIKAAMAGNPDVQTVELPGLNHLFQTAGTGAVSEYQKIEETMAPAALETITDWVTAHTR